MSHLWRLCTITVYQTYLTVFPHHAMQDRDYYESIIMSLGGEVTSKSTFDPSATHLVCSRPVRSEKLLASIASGKWVLHKGYLDASQKEKHFIQV